MIMDKIEAEHIYNDVTEFFENEDKKDYLLTIVSPENIIEILEEIEKVFIESEDYEKCAIIKVWREKATKRKK